MKYTNGYTRINGAMVRKNSQRRGHYDIMETRAGKLTGKSTFTGTLKEVRAAGATRPHSRP